VLCTYEVPTLCYEGAMRGPQGIIEDHFCLGGTLGKVTKALVVEGGYGGVRIIGGISFMHQGGRRGGSSLPIVHIFAFFTLPTLG